MIIEVAGYKPMTAGFEGGLAALGRLPALEWALGGPCPASSHQLRTAGVQSLGHTSQGTSGGLLHFIYAYICSGSNTALPEPGEAESSREVLYQSKWFSIYESETWDKP